MDHRSWHSAVLGTRRIKYLEENVAAADIAMTEDEVKARDAAPYISSIEAPNSNIVGGGATSVILEAKATASRGVTLGSQRCAPWRAAVTSARVSYASALTMPYLTSSMTRIMLDFR
jgi:hypothetical protein